MDFTNPSSNKPDSITSSLSGMLWTSKVPSPFHVPNQSSEKPTLQIGLKSQFHSEEARLPTSSTDIPNIVHCYTLPRASKEPPPPSSSSLLSSSSSAFRSSVTDDVIGTESGDYMSSCLYNVDGLKKMKEKSEPPNNHSRPRYRNAMTKRYPPPIPMLAQTKDLPGRVPLVFTREVTEDGRLIIGLDIVKRREYLVAQREHGRLVMKLVPVNDAVYSEYCGLPQPLEQEEAEEVADASYDDGVEGEEELASEGSEESLCDLCKCPTYAGGLDPDSDTFCKVHGIGGANGHLGQPGSPHLRPMTPVM